MLFFYGLFILRINPRTKTFISRKYLSNQGLSCTLNRELPGVQCTAIKTNGTTKQAISALIIFVLIKINHIILKVSILYLRNSKAQFQSFAG